MPVDVDLSEVDEGNVHDVTVKNIVVYYDDEIISDNGKAILPVLVKSFREDVNFYNINISNIKVNDEPFEIEYQ